MTPPLGTKLATSVSSHHGLIAQFFRRLSVCSCKPHSIAVRVATPPSSHCFIPCALCLPADADRPGRKPWISEMYGYSFGASSSNVWHHVDYAAMLYPTYKPIGEDAGLGSRLH